MTRGPADSLEDHQRLALANISVLYETKLIKLRYSYEKTYTFMWAILLGYKDFPK